ncbi:MULTISPECIES: hypothetical protein [Streptomyces]|uniref:Uncharacterized protein n=1 Tax=Streptomyces kaniharaensis TaxID=212423 RepID=A0A6N7L5L2_9ACTN|nr:hypothetical protein [Streptomyces kaniharaensis]MQS17293.1 hypothetical protein [Streptomyces kaniharaensis]
MAGSTDPTDDPVRLGERLATARAELETARGRVTALEREVTALEERIVAAQSAAALARGGTEGVLRWWSERGRGRDEDHKRTAMRAWMQSVHPSLSWPDFRPGKGPVNINWRVERSSTPEETAAVARELDRIGAAVRAVRSQDVPLAGLHVLVIAPRTGPMRFGDQFPKPCLVVRLQPHGWDLVTPSERPLTLGASQEDFLPLLEQARVAALSLAADA